MVYIDHSREEREHKWNQYLLSTLPQCLREKFDRVGWIQTSRYLDNLKKFQEESRKSKIFVGEQEPGKDIVSRCSL